MESSPFWTDCSATFQTDMIHSAAVRWDQEVNGGERRTLFVATALWGRLAGTKQSEQDKYTPTRCAQYMSCALWRPKAEAQIAKQFESLKLVLMF